MSTEAERTIEAYQQGVFNIDGWVIMYPSSDDQGSLFVTVTPTPTANSPWPCSNTEKLRWGGGGLNGCTVFETWEEASKVAVRIPYIMKQPPHLRRILKLKIKHSYELIEDCSVDLLDALAEL